MKLSQSAQPYALLMLFFVKCFGQDFAIFRHSLNICKRYKHAVPTVVLTYGSKVLRVNFYKIVTNC
jgi:hypothetical protein